MRFKLPPRKKPEPLLHDVIRLVSPKGEGPLWLSPGDDVFPLESLGPVPPPLSAAYSNTLCIYDITSCIQYNSNSKREHTEAGDRFESLAHVIQYSIFPDQWTQAGGNSELLPWKTKNNIRMVVVAPYETQFAIQALFTTEAKLTADATRHSRAPNVQSNQVGNRSTVWHSQLKRP